MKATAQKLKKFKTKQVYGFKKELSGSFVNGDPTITSSLCTTSSGIMVHAQVQ
jgi:hypothetical protein